VDLLMNLMLKGSDSFHGDAFAEKIENLGAMLSVDVKEEVTIFEFQMLADAALELVPLFWQMIMKPALVESEFKQLKKEMGAGLKAEISDPSLLAKKHFVAQLFSPQHPAGRFCNTSSLHKISRSSLKDFYHSSFSPAGGICICAGAFSISEMKKQWFDLIQSWKPVISKPMTTVQIPRFTKEQSTETHIRVVDKHDLTQTTLIFGAPCIVPQYEKKIELAVANYILGGGSFSSRLMQTIRTETGQAYGISSQIVNHKNFGFLTITTSTLTNQLKNVISLIIEVYQDLIKNGPTKSELEKAQQFAIGSMAFELEGLLNIVDKLMWLRIFGRSDDYIESYDEMIMALTNDRIKESLQSALPSNDFYIVAVGKKQDILPQIGGFGKPLLYHYRQNPLKESIKSTR
ncbi:MAG: insulinase family protein, partial [Chitinivibrionales bacterium]|nr:insulinase family protein [Chitinivibrionales bacterium]